jgi:hypothetical protein
LAFVRRHQKDVYGLLIQSAADSIVNNLIDLYEVWNKPEKAEKWRAKLPQTEAKTE